MDDNGALKEPHRTDTQVGPYDARSEPTEPFRLSMRAHVQG